MKKIAALFCFISVSMAAYAQDITGDWKKESNRQSTPTTEVISFLADGTTKTSVSISMTQPVPDAEFKFAISISFDGRYKCDGNQLEMQIDPDSVNVDVTSETQSYSAEVNEVSVQMCKELKQVTEKQLKKKVKKPLQFTIRSVSATELVLLDLSEKDATPTTYYKVQ